MGDLLDETREAIALFDGTLVVGNHDSITLLGNSAQLKLRDYSRAVSKLLMRNHDELNTAIEDVVSEIGQFENRMLSGQSSLRSAKNRGRQLSREYSTIVSYIEQMCLIFQLQEAQLLKEVKLLEKLSVTVGESAVALEECIRAGKELLTEKSSNPPNRLTNSSTLLSDDKDLALWYSRLERRIDDLCVSHTIALQNQAQIRILYDNNLMLLDRISASISNTFPIWRNQMATLLGLENLRSKQQGDISGAQTINCKLKEALAEAAALEKRDVAIRRDLQEAVKHMERG